MTSSRYCLRFAALLLLAACNSEASKKTAPETPASADTATPAPETATGPRCFLKALNRDTTLVRLEFSGDSVSGSMEWLPWEKDRAVGTLSGVKTKTGELDLIYRYTIEGSKQTETQRMTLEGNLLRIKVGELEDPANNGHLRYKDVSKATYRDELHEVPCP